jgi:3-dehydroquinate dehydratase-1
MKGCLVLTESSVKRALSIVEMFDLIELRLDICGFKTSHLKGIFALGKEIIATYREDSSKASNHKMDQLKAAIELGAKYIDIEIELDEKQQEELIIHAKGYGVKVIISYHNYEKTPRIEELKEIISKARQKGADLVKIATKVNFRNDCLTLFNLYEGEENLIAFGMGDDAKFTRVTALFLGSPFTYIYFLSQNKTAEGQLSYKEFDLMVKNLGS